MDHIVSLNKQDIWLMNKILMDKAKGVERIGYLFKVIGMYEYLTDSELDSLLEDDEEVQNLFRRIKLPNGEIGGKEE